MTNLKELTKRQEIVNYAASMIESISIGLARYAQGSDVEYGYIREKLDKLNTVIEQDVK